MPVRKVKHRRLKKYAVGDMRERIKIHSRDIQGPGLDSAEFSESYDAGDPRWANVETLDLQGSAQKRFDNVELSERPSHIFTIRYRKGTTIENVIGWDGDLFRIIATQNPDGRKQYHELIAVSRGSDDLDANQ